jgi:hypothetical protein
MEFIWFYFAVFSVVFWWLWLELCKAAERGAKDDGSYEPLPNDFRQPGSF